MRLSNYYRMTSGKPVVFNSAASLASMVEHRLIKTQMNTGAWWTLRSNGRPRFWKRDPKRFRIPYKVGIGICGALTGEDIILSNDPLYCEGVQ